ncbi:MAG: alginate export family protein, partial [Gemmatimonadetes bacterium]|nr:alginate export family protein [Gemmatimonadota bacterium]
MLSRWLVGIAIIVVIASGVEATDIEFGGQIRPRTEFRDPVGNGYDVLTSMRARLNITANLEQDVNVFIQLQDVRLWGEESDTFTDYNADNFDFHQAYMDIKDMGDTALSLRIGRQAIGLGGQRIIGAVEWAQQGRTFDGVLVTVKPQWGTIQGVGVRLSDTTAKDISGNAYLAALYATASGTSTSADFYGIYHHVSPEGSNRSDNTRLWTLGARIYGEKSNWIYRAEGSFQTGERRGPNGSAFMFGGRLGTTLGSGSLTLWYDYLSGDGNFKDSKWKSFDTLFATNHKYYGFADLFLNIPVHTRDRGLQDFAIKASVPLDEEGRIRLAADGHVFFLAQKGDLES